MATIKITPDSLLSKSLFGGPTLLQLIDASKLNLLQPVLEIGKKEAQSQSLQQKAQADQSLEVVKGDIKKMLELLGGQIEEKLMRLEHSLNTSKPDNQKENDKEKKDKTAI